MSIICMMTKSVALKQASDLEPVAPVCGRIICKTQRGYLPKQQKRKHKKYVINSQLARFMGLTWGPPGADKMGPMLAPWTFLSGFIPQPAQ